MAEPPMVTVPKSSESGTSAMAGKAATMLPVPESPRLTVARGVIGGEGEAPVVGPGVGGGVGDRERLGLSRPDREGGRGAPGELPAGAAAGGDGGDGESAPPLFWTWETSEADAPTWTVRKSSAGGTRATAGVGTAAPCAVRPRFATGRAGSLLDTARQRVGVDVGGGVGHGEGDDWPGATEKGRPAPGELGAGAAAGGDVRDGERGGAAVLDLGRPLGRVPDGHGAEVEGGGGEGDCRRGGRRAVAAHREVDRGPEGVGARQGEAPGVAGGRGGRVGHREGGAASRRDGEGGGRRPGEDARGPAQGVIEVTSRGALPAFWTWVGSVAEPPTVTVPKESEPGESAMAGAAGAPVAQAEVGWWRWRGRCSEVEAPHLAVGVGRGVGDGQGGAPPGRDVTGAAGDQVNSVLVPAHRVMAGDVQGGRARVPDGGGERRGADVHGAEAERRGRERDDRVGGATTVKELVWTRSSRARRRGGVQLGPKKAPPASNWLPYQATHPVSVPGVVGAGALRSDGEALCRSRGRRSRGGGYPPAPAPPAGGSGRRGWRAPSRGDIPHFTVTVTVSPGA